MNTNHRAASMLLALAGMLMAATPHAKAQIGREAKSSSFVTNPTAELAEKFPMCESFLRVQWISKGRQIGYTQVDAILENKNGAATGRGVVSVLLFMKGDPDMNYELSSYKNEGKLDALFEALRRGDIKDGWSGTGYIVSYLNDDFVLNYGGGPEDGSFSIVLGDFQKTLCVVYPDGKRAWIAQGKAVQKNHPPQSLDSLFKKLASQGAEITEREFAHSWELDVNGDGMPDYVTHSRRGFVTYSSGNEEYKTSVLHPSRKPQKNAADRDTKFALPSDYQRCIARQSDATYITTDGKGYFLNNQCSLTKATMRGSV